ncbi:MAG: hypothetical protein ACOX3J_12125 [Clostridia bacterium]
MDIKGGKRHAEVLSVVGIVYEEGVAQFSIGYTKTPNKKYGPLSDPGT